MKSGVKDTKERKIIASLLKLGHSYSDIQKIAITAALLALIFLGCTQRASRTGKYEPLSEYITVLKNALLVRRTQPLGIGRLRLLFYSCLDRL